MCLHLRWGTRSPAQKASLDLKNELCNGLSAISQNVTQVQHQPVSLEYTW